MTPTRRIAWVGAFEHPEWRTTETKYADALTRRGVEVTRLRSPWDDLERVVDRNRIDTVLFGRCKGLSLTRLQALRNRPMRPRLVQVLFDVMDYPERRIPGLPWPTRNRLERWVPMARQFDAVVLKDQGLFDRYARLGVACVYLDQAAEPVGNRGAAIPFTEDHDVTFIGAGNRSRRPRFLTLAEGLDAVAYGHGWTSLDVGRSKVKRRPPALGLDFVRAVRSAKVVWGESGRHDVAGYWSDRVYQVLAAGGVFLTRYTPGLEEVFEHRRHLMHYETLDEGREMLEELLTNPSLRRRLRGEGQALVEARHTYDHRAEELLEILDRLQSAQA